MTFVKHANFLRYLRQTQFTFAEKFIDTSCNLRRQLKIQSKMNTFFVLLVCSMIFGQARAGDGDSDVNEDEILEKLLSHCDQPTLTVFQTRSYLEILRVHYASDPKKFLSQAEAIKYLELAQSTERASCFKEEIYERIEFSRKHAKNQCNLDKFMQYQKELYTERCDKGPTNAYLDSIAKIPRATQKELIKLAKSVRIKSKTKFNSNPFYSEEALVEGTYNYLVEIALGVKITEKQTECGIKIKKFSKLYKAKVESLCKQTGDEFRTQTKTLLNKIGSNTRVLTSFDLVVRSWLLAGSVCLEVIDKERSIETLVYNQYRDNKPESLLRYLCFFY